VLIWLSLLAAVYWLAKWTIHAPTTDIRTLERQFAPIAVVDVELRAPFQAIPARDSSGHRYGRARVLVRLHTIPLGSLDIEMTDEGVTACACATAIWSAFGDQINEHLRSDGLAAVSGLGTGGLPVGEPPSCLRRREALLRNAPLASVIICTRNRPEVLARTLRSLERLDYPAFEVLVMDGSWSTATADIVRSEFPDVRYCHVGDVGKSVALNVGIEIASGEIVASTDDDVVVDRHWLVELVSALESDGRVACVTGLAYPLELSTQAQLWFEESGGFTEGYERRILDPEVPEEGSLLPYATGRIGAGVNMAWRRQIIRDLGGFDVALDSAEDLGAFFDALINGFKIIYEPAAIVYHEHRRTYEELRRQLYWHGSGLGAYLTRCIVTQPARIPDFVRRVPRGLFYGFSSKSTRNREKSRAFPRALTRAEQLGVMFGPHAYLKALVRSRVRGSRATVQRWLLARIGSRSASS
jgi:GT2 family glycosyltransferase